MKMVTLNNSRAPILLNTTHSTKPVPVLNLATLKAGECPDYESVGGGTEGLKDHQTSALVGAPVCNLHTTIKW